MNQKRIVIIEGDAFDADAIVAIIKFRASNKFGVVARFQDGIHAFDFQDAPTRDKAMDLAIDAWRKAVGDMVDAIPPTPAEPLPAPDREDTQVFEFWIDGKGRYRETYNGQHVLWGNVTGRFVWNEGPPRRKNPLGEGASPIVKIYVDDAGKPLEQQPI